MNMNLIDRNEDVLGTAVLLIAVRELGNSKGNLHGCQLSSCKGDLRRKLGVGKDVVV